MAMLVAATCTPPGGFVDEDDRDDACSLRTLRLDRNRLGDSGVSILVRGILDQQNKKLGMGVDDEFQQGVLHSVTSLFLRSVGMSSNGGQSLAEALTQLVDLLVVAIDGNPIGNDSGMLFLCKL